MGIPIFSIRWKLLGGFAGLALLVLLVVLFAVSRFLDNRIREDINSNFQEAGMIFNQLQDVRFSQLLQAATLVAEMPYLKAAISTGDTTTVNDQIRNDIAQLLDFSPLITDTLTVLPVDAGTNDIGLMMVYDSEGNQLGRLTNTGEIPVTLSFSQEGYPGLQQALQGEFPAHSYIWDQSGSYFNVITIPVMLQGELIGALALGYPISNHEAVLFSRLINYEVSYFMEDQLLATSIETLSGSAFNNLSRNIQNTVFNENQSIQGTTLEMNLDGEPWLVYVLPLGDTSENSTGVAGYYTVYQSLDTVLKPLHELQRVIYMIGLGGIVIAILLGVTMTNSVTRPINRLLQGIKRIENNDYSQPVEVVSRDEFGQLTVTFNSLVANISENLREKETLLAEIHHRVKNNLAVISGLLELEGDSSLDQNTKRALQNSRLRIQSMATVHEMLYQAKNFSKLSFDNFVSKMVSSIEDVYLSDRTNINIVTDLEDVELNVNQAVPGGMIINELVTNAVKHAYPDGKSGTIRILLLEDGGNITIRISDDGVGLPEEFNVHSGDSLGFTLVGILAKQINAVMNVNNTNGTQGTDISIVFGKRDKKGSNSRLS